MICNFYLYTLNMFVKVMAKAGAKIEVFEKVSETHFKISIKEPAKQNLANQRIRALIARHFKVSGASVRIINGHHSPSKLLSIA